jgi:hypothetical protein
MHYLYIPCPESSETMPRGGLPCGGWMWNAADDGNLWGSEFGKPPPKMHETQPGRRTGSGMVAPGRPKLPKWARLRNACRALPSVLDWAAPHV